MADLAHEAQQSRQTQPDVVIKVQNRFRRSFTRPAQSQPQARLPTSNWTSRPGEFVTVVGPSGCGKSTLLKLIAGFSPRLGRSDSFQGDEVRGLNTRVGYVPQESKLFPWLTVEENVGFGLSSKRFSRADRERQVDSFYQPRGLSTASKNIIPRNSRAAWANELPSSARSAYEPPVILMDEPFGPLDAQTRMVLQDELLKIWEQKRQTIVFVTHDLVEAVALADRVVVMTHRPGKIKDVIKVHDDPAAQYF